MAVFVVDKRKKPLMPCSEKRACVARVTALMPVIIVPCPPPSRRAILPDGRA